MSPRTLISTGVPPRSNCSYELVDPQLSVVAAEEETIDKPF